jgi:hypothetical protein
MGKVYLVTSGEYSDYCVLKAFAREEDAWAYPFGDDVEEFELHAGPVEVRTWHTIRWWPDPPSGPGYRGDEPNPYEHREQRDFDGNPNHARHEWTTPPNPYNPRALIVQGWELERVRKVYSEQRAQYLARQDMGVEQT